MQVSAEEIEQPGSSERPAAAHPYSLVPNVTDRKRPVFDTTGFALKCLKSVWLYDPTGPLADDALMATAVHYVRKGNLREADYYFDMLRQEYPKSEFCQKAFVLGSKVKLANYQGPRYDSKHLSAADELLRTSLAIYPNLEERDQLQSDLKRVQEQAAERDYSHGIYYERRGKPQAAVIYYETVVNEHPDTSWAEKARERLAELGPQDWSVKPRGPEAPAAIASVSVDGNVRKSFIPKPKLWPFTSTNKAPETVTPIDDEPTFIQQLVPDDEELGSESTGSARVD